MNVLSSYNKIKKCLVLNRVTEKMTKILMVDDEPDLDILIQQRFRNEIKSGLYEFLFARNGARALDVIHQNPDIGLVLTDLNMPEMNGLELLLQLKKDSPNIRILIISAYGDSESKSLAKKAGAEGFITKPIVFSELEEKIKTLIAA